LIPEEIPDRSSKDFNTSDNKFGDFRFEKIVYNIWTYTQNPCKSKNQIANQCYDDIRIEKIPQELPP